MEAAVEEIAKRHLRLVRQRDGFVGAACPFHKGGKEQRPSFWINKQNGAWGCFSCGTHGSDLRSLMSKMGVSIPGIARLLKEFEEDAKREEGINKLRESKRRKKSFEGEYQLPEELLGVFDWCPNFLLKAGFSKDILKEHDIGYDKNRNRITFPIRDMHGNLIGISGRAMENIEPKYKVYSGRTYDESGNVVDMGELGEFFPDYSSSGIRDHLWRCDKVFYRLYHGKVPPDEINLIVVEGYKAALWLVQCGWINTVALMGAFMSNSQERIIRMLGVPTWILLDNNEAGRRGTDNIRDKLGDTTFPVYCCQYLPYHQETVQPDNCTAFEIEEIFRRSQRAGGKHVTSSKDEHQGRYGKRWSHR